MIDNRNRNLNTVQDVLQTDGEVIDDLQWYGYDPDGNAPNEFDDLPYVEVNNVNVPQDLVDYLEININPLAASGTMRIDINLNALNRPNEYLDN